MQASGALSLANTITQRHKQTMGKKKDNKAMIVLISSIHSDLTLNLTTCEQSAKAWKYLAGRFDRDTGNTSIQLFRTLTGLRLRDGDDLRTHLDLFHQTWTRMQKRCISSSQAVAKSMLPIFESDDVKGSFFLTTLPESMDTYHRQPISAFPHSGPPNRCSLEAHCYTFPLCPRKIR